MKTTTLADITALLQLPAPAQGNRVVTGVNTLTEASESELSFLGSDAYLGDFAGTRAAAVLVQKRVKILERSPTAVLIVDDADLAVARILHLFAPPIPEPAVGIDISARIAPSAEIDPTARIGPFVVVGERSRIGRNCVLHAHVFVGSDVSVGDDCHLYPNVVVRERITIGNRVLIHASSVLGTDGFGYRWDGQQHAKIPQIGTVIIEDDVEIGSCVCIDRAKFSSTRVGRGTKIDNLVQVAHNCQIGPHCIIVGQVGLAGSVRLGTGVVLGGQSAVRDHVKMGDQSMLAACSGVMEDVEAKMTVSGLPALPHRQTLREQAAIRRLPDIVTQMRKLQDEVEQIKKSLNK